MRHLPQATPRKPGLAGRSGQGAARAHDQSGQYNTRWGAEGLDLILSGDTGSSTISLLKNKALPVGTLLLELIYVVEAQAPKQLQLSRFLPATPVRLLLDKNGTNLAAQVSLRALTVN